MQSDDIFWILIFFLITLRQTQHIICLFLLRDQRASQVAITNQQHILYTPYLLKCKEDINLRLFRLAHVMLKLRCFFYAAAQPPTSQAYEADWPTTPRRSVFFCIQQKEARARRIYYQFDAIGSTIVGDPEYGAAKSTRP